MALEEIQREIFKKGSKTYFNSSIFFPRGVREDVFILYGFVRIVDNFVDDLPQDPDGFFEFRRLYRQSIRGNKGGNVIIDSFVDLVDKAGIQMVLADFDGRKSTIPEEIIKAAGLLSFELRQRGIWLGTMGVGANAHPELIWSAKVAAAHRKISREKNTSLFSEWLGLARQNFNSIISLARSGYDPATIRENFLSALKNIIR